MMMKRVSSDNCGYVGAAWETVNESKETVNESVEDKGLAGSSKIQRSHKDVKPSIFKFIDAERPRHVAPRGRSGLRERPQWVALRGRSGLRFVSSRHRDASDLGVSLWEVAPRGSSTSVPCSVGGDEPTARPAGVKAAKGKSKAAVSKGKTSEAEGKLCVDFQNMWEIKQKDFVL
ncbi:hypothetical protein DY000_02035605 [Brassica cretica]|uniref:Uncharacterized protein n=1 Tax=Brassica cretica TaxID=69181 RepID=A0ABQ7DQA4_BRACR|nr:hypothetical protein DY000_02035605 [Brassica cretica]